jgi:hypothetical protein
MFNKSIKANGKIVNQNIINLFGFAFQGQNIYKWGEMFYNIMIIIYICKFGKNFFIIDIKFRRIMSKLT